MATPTAQRKLAKLVHELKKRTELPQAVRSLCFDKQLSLIDHPARRKAAITTRRAGKSTTAAYYAVIEALARPACSVLLLAKTRDHVRRIYLKDIFGPLFRQIGITPKINLQKLEIELPNKSVIYLGGADSDADEMNKLLGQKFVLAIIDEAAFWSQDVDQMIQQVLEPTLIDQDGTLLLISTPSNKHDSLFYRITTQHIPGWTVFKWTTYDNPHQRIQFERKIAELKQENPTIETTAYFRQMYLGEWAIETSALVYQWSESNRIATLPRPLEEYTVGLSMDLGWNDDTAFIIGAWHPHDTKFYILYAYKRSKMLMHDVDDMLKALQIQYNPQVFIGDSISLQLMQELRIRYGWPFQNPTKYKKEEFISTMNADFVTGKICTLPDTNMLTDEYKTLIWEPNTIPRRVPKGSADHAADATLYLWRFARSQVQYEPENIQTPEEAIEIEMESRYVQQNSMPWWEQ